MPELLAALDVLLAAARDWATLLFAVLAAGYGWRIDRELRRDRTVLIDGFARRAGSKTLRLDIAVRNRTRTAILIERLEVLTPSPSVLAMEGIHEPGPGPIRCRLLVPSHARGRVGFLLGSPEQDRQIRVRCSYRPHPRRLALRRRRIVTVDPTARPAAGVAEDGGRDTGRSIDDGVDGDE
jgi:hypothetical protein